MNNIYIIIILLIIIFLLYKNKSEKFSSHEAILNLTQMYTDASGTMLLNNIRGSNIWSNKIYSNDISGSNIWSNKIYSNDISGNNIRGRNIWSNKIYSNDISGNNIYGSNINIKKINESDNENTATININDDNRVYINKEVIIKGKLCIEEDSIDNPKKICLSPDPSVFGGLNITKKDGNSFNIFTNGNNVGFGISPTSNTQDTKWTVLV